MPSIKDRIFTRTGKKRDTPRYYIDLRDLGQGRKALKMPGDRYAVTDEETAVALAEQALEDALADRRERAKGGVRQVAKLEEYAKRHVRLKEEAGEVTDLTLSKYRIALYDAAVDFFGAERRLDSITPQDLEGYLEYLRQRPNGRGGTISKSTQRWYLNCLGNMFKRAVAEGAARANPVRNMFKKPTPERRESDFLEVPEAALLLEAARVRDPGELYPIVAAFLLTGMRRSELLGLRVEDVDFDRGVLRVRENQHRRVKTDGSERTIPLWPQLRSILRDYLFGREEPLEDLLFPGSDGGMITDMRKSLDAIGKAAGFEEGRIRTRLFRHTYTATRLQTTDNGAPVSPYTVSKELGHASTRMVERVYAHLGNVRVRSEVVEYRADEFPDLEDRLEALRAAS